MHLSARPLALILAASALSAAAEPPRLATAGMSVHAALPTGTLDRDVRQQWGFGFSFQGYFGLADRVALRPAFTWTGYRVNDRTWGSQVLASLLNANSSDEALVLRSWQLGADVVAYREGGWRGPYLLGGAGIQRAQLSLDQRWTDYSGPEPKSGVENLASWEALHSPYLQAGMGVQFEHGYVEGRVVGWRYRAAPGVRLLDTPLRAPLATREAVSLVACMGIRF